MLSFIVTSLKHSFLSLMSLSCTVGGIAVAPAKGSSRICGGVTAVWRPFAFHLD
jgi:hypothetical protein